MRGRAFLLNGYADEDVGVPNAASMPNESRRAAHSNSISKVKQGGDERAKKTVHLARLGAREEANAVSPMKWNWNQKLPRNPTSRPRLGSDAMSFSGDACTRAS